MRAAAGYGSRPFLQGHPMTDAASPTPEDKRTARRTNDTYFVAWEKRTALVKNGLAEERAACDVKTTKLRALRLAKEEADREASRIAIKKRVLANEQKNAARAVR
jgi:hypothetical protein